MQIHADTVRVGIHSGQQYRTFEEALGLWQRAERLGFDWVSLFDHFRPPLGGPAGPCLDGLSLLSALAARTTRIRCAVLVSAVTWRHPALAAAAAATVDHVSGGRLEFGIGAAGPDLAYEQYGIPFPSAGTRLDMLDEACHVLRGLWSAPSTSFEGKHFRLTDAHLEPKPVQRHLPLVIGGEGERRMLRIVAEHADIWNTLAGTPDHYQRKLTSLRRHCAEVGRDPDDIRKSVTFRAVLGSSPQEAEQRARELRHRIGADSPVWSEYVVIGTPEQCVERLRPYLDLGVRDFLLGARPPVDWHTCELFARHVAPALRAYAPAG
ncbi:TIGR03560 family F420-dependent LLM class oxidoreductase [Streptomyces sp. TG1A-8]|uniref:TIGR03560 family F420-dependent LLM class oxidoreductase n=1 Tax=Streptomyces sp. TG1A-8 TaxID=3051385 RepID=UPI00265C394A|nr:TIGR03560 family F420-dependent LLM class oxidoreductase [Streptomyces sp. TG1A-8]MDO0928878.1 TIGR03560 family F420-dependent LLM class oxidoreductase [Streptomyces sp. TG1A-8]